MGDVSWVGELKPGTVVTFPTGFQTTVDTWIAMSQGAALDYIDDYLNPKVKAAENIIRHLAGKHDQSTHGRGGGGMGRIPLDEATANEMRAYGSAGPHIVQKADGTFGFTPEREALHDQIVSDALAGVPRSDNPTVTFLGGGAASGKSSALAASSDTGKKVIVNPDEVKEKLPEYKAKGTEGAAFTHEESSYIAKRIQAAAIEGKKDILVDAVGDTSADSMGKKIDAAKAAGYTVKGTYVTVPTNVALQRAQSRAARTGRVVPEKNLRSGHRGVSNTFPQIMNRFDEVQLFDNLDGLKLIGSGKNGRFTIENQDLWGSFLAKGSE